MIQGVIGIVLIVSLFLIIYGLIKNKNSVKKLGYGGLVFVILATISDYIYYLDI